MAKHLVSVGNSLAFVIDKPVLSMLGIGRRTLLRMLVDGRRIILEPVSDAAIMADPVRRRMTAERSFKERTEAAEVTLDKLCAYQIGPYLRDLGEGLTIERYRRDLATSRRDDLREAEIGPKLDRIMARLEICLDMLDAGRTWSEAIAAARLAHPITDSSDTGTAAS